jgi:endonuclease-3
MLFELHERGYRSPFAQLVACLLSIRTRDEVSLPAALRLLEEADSPGKILAVSREALAGLIQPCTFSFQKADTLRKISQILVEEHKDLCDPDFLLSLPGVGPKCANLVLGIACGQPRIGVDVHVHRITNRWGLACAPSPEKTLAQLEKKIPQELWVETNELLVPFGKHICLGSRPKCSTCPVLDFCRQVGVRDWQ